MLLPESFETVAPEAFVTWDEDARAIAGLAAFHPVRGETVHTGVIVVRPYRRQGIGSSLLRQVVERATERGDRRVRAQVDLVAHPEAHAFLTANGFLRGSILREVEGDLAAGRGPLLDLYARLAAAGSIPANARIAGSDEFSPSELERLYKELVAPILASPPELTGSIVRGPNFKAVVVIAGNEPAGLMMCVYNDGAGTGRILATAVAPQFRAWGWVNVMLLVGAMDRGWTAGTRRLRFEMDESNLNMMSQAARLNSRVIRRRASYAFELSAPAEAVLGASSS